MRFLTRWWNRRIKGFRNLGNFFLCNPESKKFKSWNQESWALESRIKLKESGIPLPIGIWNLIKFHWQRLESSTWNPESTARSPESKTVLDFLTWSEEKKLGKNWDGLNSRERVVSDVNKGCLIRDVQLYKGVCVFFFFFALSDPNKVSIGFVITVMNSLWMWLVSIFSCILTVASLQGKEPVMFSPTNSLKTPHGL